MKAKDIKPGGRKSVDMTAITIKVPGKLNRATAFLVLQDALHMYKSRTERLYENNDPLCFRNDVRACDALRMALADRDRSRVDYAVVLVPYD